MLLYVIIALSVAVFSGIGAFAYGRSNSEYRMPITSVKTEDNGIALSVNVYEYTDTDALIKNLGKNKATFFISEAFQEMFSDKVRSIMQAGHSIGILEDEPENFSKNELYDRLAVRIERMARLTGKNTDLIRFDTENADEALVKTVYSLGLFPIQWNDPEQLSAGNIILINEKTAKEFIKKSAEDGLETVTVDELILKNGFKVDFSGVQSAL